MDMQYQGRIMGDRVYVCHGHAVPRQDDERSCICVSWTCSTKAGSWAIVYMCVMDMQHQGRIMSDRVCVSWTCSIKAGSWAIVYVCHGHAVPRHDHDRSCICVSWTCSTKAGSWAIVYICVMVWMLHLFFDYKLNCSNSVVFFVIFVAEGWHFLL